MSSTPVAAAAAPDIQNLRMVELDNLIVSKEYYVVTRVVDDNTKDFLPMSAPIKRTLSSITRQVAETGKDITYTNTFTFRDGETYTLSVTGMSDLKNKGTAAMFYEIPAVAGGKRRNNKRKSVRRGGRISKRMRRANNRKSSRRF